MMEPIIQIQKLSKTFSHGGKQVHVIKNMDFEILESDFTVIMGRSGSGKSTLMYAISGMDKPTLGDIHINGQNIATMTNDQLAIFRRKNCGFVFQQIYLMDNMSVLDNILSSGLLISPDKKAVASKAKELLLKVHLEESLWDKFPSQLSGGEAQRVGIVRALINNPRLMFADEPTGALNSASGTAVLDVLTELNQTGQSVIMVTHDLKSAVRGNRIVYLRDGAVVGILELAAYEQDHSSQRLEKLQSFLNDMGW